MFETMLGLPGGFLVPEDRAVNRSLTVAEAELVRRLNEEFSRREWPHRNYARFMRYGTVEHMKTTPPAVTRRAENRDAGLGAGPGRGYQRRDGRPHRGSRRERRR